MADLDTCLAASVAVTGASLGVAFIALIDALFRDIPTLIAKARLTVVITLCLSVTTTLHSGGFARASVSAAQAALPIILFTPTALSAQLYFSEIFLQLCVSTSRLNGVVLSDRVTLWVASLPWARALSVLHAVALVVAFQFEPTNATMFACYTGFVVLWISNFAMASIVAFMIHLISSHAKQNVRRLPAEVKTLMYQMVAFIIGCVVFGVNRLQLDIERASALARDLQSTWQPPICDLDVLKLVSMFILTVFVLYLTRSRHSKPRFWVSSFSQLASTVYTAKRSPDPQSETELEVSSPEDSCNKGDDRDDRRRDKTTLRDLDEEFMDGRRDKTTLRDLDEEFMNGRRDKTTLRDLDEEFMDGRRDKTTLRDLDEEFMKSSIDPDLV